MGSIKPLTVKLLAGEQKATEKTRVIGGQEETFREIRRGPLLCQAASVRGSSKLAPKPVLGSAGESEGSAGYLVSDSFTGGLDIGLPAAVMEVQANGRSLTRQRPVISVTWCSCTRSEADQVGVSCPDLWTQAKDCAQEKQAGLSKAGQERREASLHV